MKRLILAMAMGVGVVRAELPEPSAAKLPQWHGFNLQNLFWEGARNVPFEESDFKRIAEMGGNFIRIPVTYKLITKPDDFREIDPDRLVQLEQALAWGKKYNIHICLNLFQVPGHCITKEDNPRWPADWNLWTNEEAQAVFSNYWKFLAKRYRDVPNRNLSFNLINEPFWDTTELQYAKVMKQAIGAVRAEDPDRLMIVDGLNAATEPCWALAGEGVAQAIHFYKPMALTHYKADWMANPPSRLPPAWPLPLVSTHLYGPLQKMDVPPLVIRGGFDQPHRMTVQVGDVCGSRKIPMVFQVLADGKPVYEKSFMPESGIFHADPGVYEFALNQDIDAGIPAGTKTVVLQVASGDRMTLRGVVLENETSGARHELVPVVDEWGSIQSPLNYDPATGFTAEKHIDRAWLFEKYLKPFQTLEEKGVGVMVMEFGCFNQTPHRMVLDWMDDCLGMFADAGWGWAMWEWKGPFGPINSGRPDVDYVERNGVQLDEEMLDLLERKLRE